MARRQRIVVRRKKAPTKFLKKVGKWFKKQGKKLKQGIGKAKLLWRAKVSKKPIRRKDLERAGMMTPELKAQYDMIDQIKAAEKGGGDGGFQSHADMPGASGGGRSGGGVKKPKLMPNMAGGSISARWKARNANRKAKLKNMFAANNSSPATKRHINIKLNSVGQNAATADKNSKKHYQNNFKKAVRPRVLKNKNQKYKY